METGLELINASEMFAGVLRILERLERVDQGYRRNHHHSDDPVAKLQMTSEDVLSALSTKLPSLQQCLLATSLRQFCLQRLMRWYEVRRGHYSPAVLRGVSCVWAVSIGRAGRGADLQAQCEELYGATQEELQRCRAVGPRLDKQPSPTPLVVDEDTSQHSSSASAESCSEDDLTATQEDEQWKLLCLPGADSFTD